MRDVLVIDKLRQIPVLDPVLVPHILMLMMKVLEEFRKPDRRKSLLIERRMVAAPQIPVKPEHERRLHPSVIGGANLSDISGQLPGSRIALATKPANPPQVLLRSRYRQPFGKHTNDGMILLRAFVPAHDIVVKHSLQIPSLLLRHLGKMAAAVEPLLFARDRKKDDRRRKLHLAQYTGTLQAYGNSAGIIIRSGGIALHVQRVAVS